MFSKKNPSKRSIAPLLFLLALLVFCKGALIWYNPSNQNSDIEHKILTGQGAKLDAHTPGKIGFVYCGMNSPETFSYNVSGLSSLNIYLPSSSERIMIKERFFEIKEVNPHYIILKGK